MTLTVTSPAITTGRLHPDLGIDATIRTLAYHQGMLTRLRQDLFDHWDRTDWPGGPVLRVAVLDILGADDPDTWTNVIHQAEAALRRTVSAEKILQNATNLIRGGYSLAPAVQYFGIDTRHIIDVQLQVLFPGLEHTAVLARASLAPGDELLDPSTQQEYLNAVDRVRIDPDLDTIVIGPLLRGCWHHNLNRILDLIGEAGLRGEQISRYLSLITETTSPEEAVEAAVVTGDTPTAEVYVQLRQDGLDIDDATETAVAILS